jgi:excinuclease ABC subunit B
MKEYSMPAFRLVSDYQPCGDQPSAIEKLTAGVLSGQRDQVLLGVTGSGKTFTMAHVIARVNLPTLVMAPNKTLAAQLYTELKKIFPDNRVEYFVSYYDYYQPEAYVPATDTYIEKDAAINEEIDKLRHAATRSVLERPDTIVVASVSCIYGLGSPADYYKMMFFAEIGDTISRADILTKLTEIQYERNDTDFHRGTFRVRGDVIEIFPAHEDLEAIRLEFFDEEIEAISTFDFVTQQKTGRLDQVSIYPASHFVAPKEKMKGAIESIKAELAERLDQLQRENKILELQRLQNRAKWDLEMMEEIGYCKGIENYSRHLDGRKPGEPPDTLLSYFPEKFLLILDESHLTIPQVRAMYRGDQVRKGTLVEHGFRLPSAIDNRPLKFEEFDRRIRHAIYVSATPAEYELNLVNRDVAEQIIRPTGLIDPVVAIRPMANAVDDLYDEIQKRIRSQERVLVTTLTKRFSEKLTDYYSGLGLKVKYLHSDVETFERVKILKSLRLGEFDVLIGINLLREGLDLPEVSLVAILDADKEGFLRSRSALIQTFGRAARNVNGEVILYADRTTAAMQEAIAETDRRRAIQKAYNEANGITPETIKKSFESALDSIFEADYYNIPLAEDKEIEKILRGQKDLPKAIEKLWKEMQAAAMNEEFERAQEILETIKKLKERELFHAG